MSLLLQVKVCQYQCWGCEIIYLEADVQINSFPFWDYLIRSVGPDIFLDWFFFSAARF